MKTTYFHGFRDRKRIALTFDDGPCRKTLEILKILKKEKVPATFFVLGKKINGNERILKQIIRQGCEIGNHSYSHANLIFKTYGRIKKELSDTDRELSRLNIRTNLMRCPHFICELITLLAAKELGKKIIFIDIDSGDWARPGKNRIMAKVLKRIRNGSIVGFHCYLEGIGENKEIIPSLKAIIPELKKRGYELVTVSKLIKK
jgi:peptidoglycan/xylan/chitin deacetylase (PgdA/CDA1 family)